MTLKEWIGLLTVASLLWAESHAQLGVCGIPPLNTRIVGGEDAPAGSWPWQVSLQKDGRHICGGSLINKEWVMSAAHCFSSVSTSGWQVSLGRQNLQGVNPNEVSINVASIILHPQYNMGSRYNNDISLLRLSSPVQFTNYIRPVCLAASDSVFNNGTGSWVTGWGAVREGVSLPSPGTLQEVQVPVVGNRQCYCLNVKLGTVTDNMICAGVLAGGKDSCQGDSGGPMVNKKGSVWVQSGIVSFGEGCARPNLPGVYTRVSRYQSWIDSQISSDKPGFVQFTSSGLDADSSYTCPGLPPPVTPATTTTSTITPVCGRAPLNSRAVGDSGVVPGGTWPWMVRLHKNGLYACGGTLITRTVVLTSAQCFSSSNPDASEWTAFLGRSLVNVSGEFEISLGIVNITVSQLAGSNIGLLHLIEPVSYKDNIQPVCMDVAASRTFPIGSQCWVAGWEKSTAAVSSVLRDLETQVASCGNVSDSENICTVTINLQQEDQGGPLLCKSGSSWFQVAVVTISGTKSVRADVQVFAKASRFGSFLRATVGDIPSSAEDATGNSTAATMNSTAATGNSTAATGNSAAATGNSTAAPGNVTAATICGIPLLNTRIVGGEDAPAGSWPWQVSLQKDGGHICGGSLINKEWVMSAAHCFSSVSTSGWQVSLGRQNLQGANPNEVSINVASIILHPQYNMGSRYNNDISLLRLSSPVQFTNYIRPVCLAASDSVFNNGTGSWVTGWGAVREGVSLPSPGTLQEVQVPVVGNRQCYCLNVKLGTVTDNMICAGVLAGGKDSCQGDSGGPMVNKKGSVWVQSGIVSFGKGCARPNLPGVYTRVSRYQSWIDSQISSDKPGFVQFTSSGLDADSSYTCPGLPPPITPATTATSTISTAGTNKTTDPASTASSTTSPSTTTSITRPSATAQIVTNPSTPVCGRAPLNSRAVGDSGVVPGGTWPWMVRLHKNGLYACGGTLITRTVVLTSAQCFSSSNPNASEWTAFLGRSLVNVSGEFEISLGIVNITVSQLAGSNIGLLHLIEPVSYKDNIQPVCMDVAASRTFPIGSQCWVAGWEKSTAAVSSVLRDLETQVASCGNVSDSENICTVTINLQQEDQGGPLLCKSGSSWFQVAVVTISGTKSVRADVQVFAKASRFGSFLRATVGDIPSPAEDATGNSTAAPGNVTAATICGIPPLNTRIVGGEDAPAGSWPWQVSLQKDGRHICGGSLINKEWVMSAAHCFSSVSTSGWQVSLGRQNLQGVNPNEVSINVASIILHPQYNMGGRFNNDISLLRLSSPVQFTNYIRPVCLAASDSVFNNGTGSWVTGWGAVREGVSLPSPGTLQEVQVPVVGNRQCYCLNVKLGTVTDNMICAGVLAGGKDSCQGDSGGPMVNKKGSVWVQSGIVSFGEGCARPNLPGVYTRVSRYQSWIDSQISSDKPGFVQFTSSGLDADSSYTCPGLPPPVTPATTTTSTISTAGTNKTTDPASTASSTTSPSTTTSITRPSATAQIVTNPSTPVCGRAPLNSRAVGDSGVVPGGTWPWMVRLHKNGLYACGGTLITRTVVLTSAQCFSSSNPNASEWTAFLGRSLVNVSGEFEISLGIVNITVSQLAGSNIGLLHLIEPVSYKDNIQPVCMDVAASRTFPIGSQCWVAGWEKSTAAVSSVLRDLETQVASCGNVSDSENICTVTINLQQEDQGGPLLCKSGSSWFQVAVVTISGTKSVRADVQVFAKASRFGSFLRATVTDIPSPAEDATGNSAAATMNSTAATGNSAAATGNVTAATSNAESFSISLLLSFAVPMTSVFRLSGL
ncbi:uncharacterized protein LOC120819052 isoform X3 [Gasterosteus aculeatus]